MKVDVLGIKIDDVTMKEAVEMVNSWLKKPGKHYIVTPNPEIVMTARRDSRLKSILNSADLAIPDGRGLRLSGLIHHTVPGIDLMEQLIELAAEKGFTVGFLGARAGVAEKCAECLQKKYPGLKIVFISAGGVVDTTGKLSDNIVIPTCDLLFVAFGHIKQEKWIADNLPKLAVKIAMGVGGSFDYLSGSIPRAPVWIRSLGCEWLFRLIIQPWRIKRQLALLQYCWLLVTSR